MIKSNIFEIGMALNFRSTTHSQEYKVLRTENIGALIISIKICLKNLPVLTIFHISY